MHPAPPTYTHLHQAHFSIQPVLCNTLSNICTDILHVIGQSPQILAEKLKVVHFDWKLAHMIYWRCWFQIQAYIFETPTPKSIFGQSCTFCLEIGPHSIWRILILNPDLDFWNSDPKIHFCENLGPKSQSCLFCLKIGSHDISRMLILIPSLVFWISNPNFLFGQICVKNVKVFHFNWKLAHMISQGCWFLFQHWFYEFPALNSFLGKFGPKRSKVFISSLTVRKQFIL